MPTRRHRFGSPYDRLDRGTQEAAFAEHVMGPALGFEDDEPEHPPEPPPPPRQDEPPPARDSSRPPLTVQTARGDVQDEPQAPLAPRVIQTAPANAGAVVEALTMPPVKQQTPFGEVDATPKLQALELSDRAKAITTIVNDRQRDAAVTLLSLLSDAESSVDNVLGPIIDQANKTHKMLTGLRTEWKDPILAGRKHLSPLIAGYELEQERARQAEIDRRRRIAEAEENARLETERQIALEHGDEEVAQAIEQEIAAPKSIAVVVPERQKPAGLSTRKTYKARVTNLLALVQHIAAHAPDLVSVLEPNQTALDALARSTTGNLKLPGVEVYLETGTVMRRR